MSRGAHSASQTAVGWVPSPLLKEQYGAIFNLCPNLQNGILQGQHAVVFLQRSGLPTDTLKSVWGVADYKKQGFLDLDAFCIACRLIAQVQDGKPCTLDALKSFSWVSLPMPVFKGINDQQQASGNTFNIQASTARPAASMDMQPAAVPSANTIDKTSVWYIPDETRNKYSQMFKSQKLNAAGHLESRLAAPFLAKSGCDNQTLSAVWKMTCNQYNCLDEAGFCSAMHLLVNVRKGKTLPTTLPLEILPQRDVAQQPSGTVLAGAASSANQALSAQAQAEAMLAKMDQEKAAIEQKKQDEINKQKEIELKKKLDKRNKKERSAAELAAKQHAEQLLELNRVASLHREAAAVNDGLQQHLQHFLSLKEKQKLLLNRYVNERADLIASKQTMNHQIQEFQSEYMENRNELISLDTDLKSLHMEARG